MIERKIDVVLENGFEKDFVPSGAAFTKKRNAARKLRIAVAEALTGTKISDDELEKCKKQFIMKITVKNTVFMVHFK